MDLGGAGGGRAGGGMGGMMSDERPGGGNRVGFPSNGQAAGGPGGETAVPFPITCNVGSASVNVLKSVYKLQL